MDKYRSCLEEGKGKRTLCNRGYCTAKLKYKVYPSAYANGYASSVCKGNKPDYEGKYHNDGWNAGQIRDVSLSRWYKEKWVNICDRRADGSYAPCGRKEAILDPKSYPYCRPLYKLPGTTVVTAGQMTDDLKDRMCKAKRAVVAQDPTGKVFIDQYGGQNPLATSNISIPEDVRAAAKLGLQLVSNGFAGGTETGWGRARQLQGSTIDLYSLAEMRAWFARHGPDASNGGTSYPGYLKWVSAGSPTHPSDSKEARSYRGAVAWLIWGGDAAYNWIHSDTIRTQLEIAFPDSKSSR